MVSSIAFKNAEVNHHSSKHNTGTHHNNNLALVTTVVEDKVVNTTVNGSMTVASLMLSVWSITYVSIPPTVASSTSCTVVGIALRSSCLLPCVSCLVRDEHMRQNHLDPMLHVWQHQAVQRHA